jgi:hypothetical protein
MSGAFALGELGLLVRNLLSYVVPPVAGAVAENGQVKRVTL